MWLPTSDERRLLATYYKTLGEPEQSAVFRIIILTRGLKKGGAKVPKFGEDDSGHDIETYFRTTTKQERDQNSVKDDELWERVVKSNTLLSERDLIVLSDVPEQIHLVEVKLKIKGYDLGRKYASFLEWSQLWYQQYKHHWLLILLAIIVGMVIDRYLLPF